MSLDSYHKKRDFKKTPEPKGRVHHRPNHLYVIQKHAASHLHYDLRLELEGVLKSWAVPKGPCLDPDVKRLAMHVEDHPIDYGTFEGIIPAGEYGGGTVMLWDEGEWESLDDDPLKAYNKGHLRFNLNGEKLQGRWDLIRFKDEKHWFLIKHKDEFCRAINDYDITVKEPLSVLTHQSIDEISENYDKVWSSRKLAKKKVKINIKLDLPKSPFPDKVSVQLATLVDKAPDTDEWIHEVKFDGYRILALKQNNKVTLLSRNQIDWTKKFQNIVDEVKELPVNNVILDGEIVMLDEKKRSSFQRLQNSLEAGDDSLFTYYLFDLLYIEHYDLRNLPLLERKKHLKALLPQKNSNLHYSDHYQGEGRKFFEHSCEFGLEGIISKKADSLYYGTRSRSWLKTKCIKRQEFVIGGFTAPKRSREYFGSLFLGVFNDSGGLVFAGNVGTGFTNESLKALHHRLEKLVIDKNPFTSRPTGFKSATWVVPEIVVEVEFTEWTEDGRLRHPSFKGLRMDKKAKDIHEEKELPVEKVKIKPKRVHPVILTHPEKILYEEDGISKQDLLNYYEQVGDYILPYIRNRPLTLVRCPSTYKECFYQKHLNSSTKKLLTVPIADKNGDEENYLYLNSKGGLAELVQMGALELHPWGSTINHLEKPDMIIFDLDPAPEIQWKAVVEAAFDVKEHLEQYRLRSFVKTTGGKGLHVVIPIKPEYDWGEVKEFTHVFVNFLEKLNPEKYISKMSKSQRKGKIFIDYLRNQRGATAIAAYSTRARLHAPVATPIDWDELTNDIKDTYYTIHTLPKRLHQLKHDPWEDFWRVKQSLRLDEL